jgi:hypothetical protein
VQGQGGSCANAPLWNQTKPFGRIADDVPINPLIQFFMENALIEDEKQTYLATKSVIRLIKTLFPHETHFHRLSHVHTDKGFVLNLVFIFT